MAAADRSGRGRSLTIVVAILSSIGWLFLSSSPVAASTISGLPAGFIAEVVANTPTISALFAPNPRQGGDPMLLLVSKTGDVKALEDPDNSDSFTTILKLGNDELCFNGERGLQSIALHPNFSENFLVYLFYNKFREGCEQETDNTPWNVVVRMPMNPDTLMLEKSAVEEIWRAPPSDKFNHNGGAMIFGNDGLLYVTTGDGGKSSNSQPLSNTHGSLIRLKDDGSVPESNPFTQSNGYNSVRCADSNGRAPEGMVCSETYANGLRNPFRIAVDPRETVKTLFTISDVGGGHWEELNYAGTDYAGKNYGYPINEGVCNHGTDRRCPMPGDHDFQDPFHWYAHRSTENGGCVSGATFVPEGLWPPKYKFLFADFVFNEVYKLVEDDGSECRSCSPPTSQFKNETFFRSARGPEDTSDDGARMTDMFFGPYKDTQVLYVVFRGNAKTVLRFRWNFIKDNGLPIPVIDMEDRNFVLGEDVQFSGSSSEDPDGDELSFAWDFGDGSTSTLENPSHTYSEPGEYTVTLVVTDMEGQEQLTSQNVVVGQPPTATIASPSDGEEFFVGQIFTLQGSAFDADGTRLDDSQLSWEVRQHHADHWHPFLDPSSGNNIELTPAPPPEDFFASTNSYLRIILTATDKNGLKTEVHRVIQPIKALVDIESNPQGLDVMVDYYLVETSDQIVSWQEHDLAVSVEDQPPYIFTSWSDGSTERNRKVKVIQDEQLIQANFCAQNGGGCDANEICCSGQCSSGFCVVGTGAPTAAPSAEATAATMAPTSNPKITATSGPSLSSTDLPSALASAAPTSGPTGKPPLATIMSPLEGQTFDVGQVFNLVGFAVDRNGFVLPADRLSWEMRLVFSSVNLDLEVSKQASVNDSGDVNRTLMNGVLGNGVDTPPCPNPPDLATVSESHIEFKMRATDLDGLTTTVTRVIYPSLASLHLYSSPQGLDIVVNGTTFITNSTIQSWKKDTLIVSVADQGPYRFESWDDDSEEASRTVDLSGWSSYVTANFCGVWDASCSINADCCRDFLCDSVTGACQSKTGLTKPADQDEVDGIGGTSAAEQSGDKVSNAVNQDNSNGGLSGAGKAIVSVLVLVLAGACLVFLVRWRRKKTHAESSSNSEFDGGDSGTAIATDVSGLDKDNIAFGRQSPPNSVNDTFDTDHDSSKDSKDGSHDIENVNIDGTTPLVAVNDNEVLTKGDNLSSKPFMDLNNKVKGAQPNGLEETNANIDRSRNLTGYGAPVNFVDQEAGAVENQVAHSMGALEA